jgi:pyruvate ferredoxin oxidoreductase gamma subunit
VLRVRFHGRGGHGIKTASRILGTAAFLAGFQAQDCPVYGAERRGAALAAFTRIDAAPICERGVVLDPDLIVVGDETLLADPTAGVLVGCDCASALFVNSPREAAVITGDHAVPCPVVSRDLTALTAEQLGLGSALSAPLGAAACALTGLVDAEVMARAVTEELAELGLSPAALEMNLALARRVFASVSALPPRRRPRRAPVAAPMHTPVPLTSPSGVPLILATGNSLLRHTGAWRFVRPVIDRDVCTRCGLCFLRCPDAAVLPDAAGYPVIDYDNCKGCMICGEECPVKCIHGQKEVTAW